MCLAFAFALTAAAAVNASAERVQHTHGLAVWVRAACPNLGSSGWRYDMLGTASDPLVSNERLLGHNVESDSTCCPQLLVGDASS
jgi:hypothetical protein